MGVLGKPTRKVHIESGSTEAKIMKTYKIRFESD